uniref:Uncharacterized protein n=1 Tax=Buteo japonicus TaxID=224669 RepID=A0A8B9YV91_9AVES
MSLPSTFHFTSGNGLSPTDLLLVTFSGPPSEMKEEMKDLKSRVEALEQKLQLVLAPFHNLMPSAPEDVGADPISRLSHSLQQLDRIDSLSEQISFLEERLETCKYLRGNRVSGHIQSQFTACSNGLDIKDFKELV